MESLYVGAAIILYNTVLTQHSTSTYDRPISLPATGFQTHPFDWMKC